MSKSTYYVNLHPNYDYSTVIVAKGGFISRDFVKEHDGQIGWLRDREFRVERGFLETLINFLTQNDENPTFYIRDSRSDEWETLCEENRYRIKI